MGGSNQNKPTPAALRQLTTMMIVHNHHDRKRLLREPFTHDADIRAVKVVPMDHLPRLNRLETPGLTDCKACSQNNSIGRNGTQQFGEGCCRWVTATLAVPGLPRKLIGLRLVYQTNHRSIAPACVTSNRAVARFTYLISLQINHSEQRHQEQNRPTSG